MSTIVNLRQLASLEKFSTEFSALSDDYLFTRIVSTDIDYARRVSPRDRSDGPVRIDGMSWLLCLGGRMELEIDLTPCTLTANCMVVTTPGSMIEIKSIDSQGLDCYMLFVSTSFIRDINFDLNVLASMGHKEHIHHSGHVLHVSESEASTLSEYFRLLHRNSTGEGEDIYTKSIARNLIAALTYEVMKTLTSRIDDSETSKAPRSRRVSYVNDFIRLVHDHHSRERTLAFYADRLFISPKYLSLIIKEATGHLASEIIDSYVILEAKNLLRFSGKNIQQIAYELNFPNQPSFGKYFKHLTGMSPSEYQRS